MWAMVTHPLRHLCSIFFRKSIVLRESLTAPSDHHCCRAYWDVNDREWGNLDEKD